MKKHSLAIALLLSTCWAITSCDDNCCIKGVNKICEADMTGTGFGTWEEYQAYLEGLDYSCN